VGVVRYAGLYNHLLCIKGEKMSELLTFDMIVSIIVFWSLALFPPLITRFVFLKKPMRKYSAYIFVVLFWFINYTAQYLAGALRQELEGGGPPHPGMIGLVLMALATFAILRQGAEPKEKPVAPNLNEKPATREDWETPKDDKQ